MLFRRYVPSGRSGAGAIAAVLVAALLAGVILGVIEGVISQWLSLFLVFPALIGVAAGVTGAGMVARYKLRAPAIALILGFLGGAAGYAAGHVTSYFRFRSEVAAAMKRDNAIASNTDVSTQIDDGLTRAVGAPGFRGYLTLSAQEGVRLKRATSHGDDGIAFKGVAAWILWMIELLIAAGVAAGIAWSRAREPFCESCETWYGPASRVAIGGAGTKAMKQQMRAALELGDVDAAARAFFGPRKDRVPAVFQLTAETCTRCHGDAFCRLDRVVTHKRTQRSKLATWLMPRSDLSRLSAAIERARPRAG